MSHIGKLVTPTWTSRRILIVIFVSLIYGVWFNLLDSIAYCPYQLEKSCDEKCSPVSIGSMFGGDQIYQPWNIIGHCIPGLFLLWLTPKRLELFVAGALISSVIMDSPLWGVLRLEHDLPLWYMDSDGQNFVNTCSIDKWISYYYNPVGLYPVWDTQVGLPNAAMIFWSIILRGVGAGLLIRVQARHEPERDFSLMRLLIRGVKRI